MPTYDYECSSCHHVQEVFHSIKEDPIIKCEKCGNVMTRLVSGGTGFIMRSGGTRSQTWKQRHGHKKNSFTTTPTESADLKAQEILKDESFREAKKTDPYAEHR